MQNQKARVSPGSSLFVQIFHSINHSSASVCGFYCNLASDCKVQPSRGTMGRRDDEQIMTKTNTKLPTHKKELQQNGYLGTVSRKNSVWGLVGGGSLNQLDTSETSPLILLQLQITNKCTF